MKNLAKLIVEVYRIMNESIKVVYTKEGCMRAITNLKIDECYYVPLIIMMETDFTRSLEWANDILSGEQGDDEKTNG